MKENLESEKLISFKEYKKSSEAKKIEVTEEFINKFIICCSLCLQASNSSIQELSEELFKFKLSTGYISETLSKASEKASKINISLSLEKVKKGALDEIFSIGSPVLVGVEPESTYIFLSQLSKSRDGNSWGYYLQDKKEKQSLEISETVMDGAKGMRVGVRDVFGATVQYDIFHAQRDWHKIVRTHETKAYRLIKEVYESDKKKKHNPRLKSKMKKAIEIYDNIQVLINWLDEALSLPRIDIAMNREENFKILLELIKETDELEGLHKSLGTWHSELLSFGISLKSELEKLIEEYGEKSVKLCWSQEFSNDNKYWKLEAKLYEYLSYQEIKILKEKISFIRRNILRASSIVEGINSLLRRYVYIHRGINQKQLELITFYLNHRKYRRSQIPNRVGKSPVDLLTGISHNSWIDILQAA